MTNCKFCGKELKAYRMGKKVCQPCRISMSRTIGKLRAIKKFGGRCEICKRQVHPASFEFHHIDPNKKDFQISKLFDKKWSSLEKELEKCQLLCSNCHREIHATRFDKRTIEAISFLRSANDKELYLDWLNEDLRTEIHNRINFLKKTKFGEVKVECNNCKKVFVVKAHRNNALFCSIKCRAIYTRKVERPSIEQLKEDVSAMPMVAVGKKYGVSDNAIRKWLKTATVV